MANLLNLNAGASNGESFFILVFRSQKVIIGLIILNNNRLNSSCRPRVSYIIIMMYGTATGPKFELFFCRRFNAKPNENLNGVEHNAIIFNGWEQNLMRKRMGGSMN